MKKIRKKKFIQDEQITVTYLFFFDILGDYSKLSSGEIRSILYEIEDNIKGAK